MLALLSLRVLHLTAGNIVDSFICAEEGELVDEPFALLEERDALQEI
jgi:hypothetical protein